jgi:hypothetical protein
MTLAIGTTCDCNYIGGAAIVLVADRRGCYMSDPNAPPLTINDQCGKLFDLLPKNFAAAISGTVPVCTALVSEIYARFEDLPNPFAGDHVRLAIREARQYDFRMWCSEQLESIHRMTIDQWLNHPNQRVYRRVEIFLKQLADEYPAYLIVTGFVSDNTPVLIRSVGAGVTEVWSSHCVIGIGEIEAFDHLHRRNKDEFTGLPETLLYMAEALGIARKKYSTEIGPTDGFIIVRPGRAMKSLHPQHPIWSELHQLHLAGKLQNNEDMRAKLDLAFTDVDTPKANAVRNAKA